LPLAQPTQARPSNGDDRQGWSRDAPHLGTSAPGYRPKHDSPPTFADLVAEFEAMDDQNAAAADRRGSHIEIFERDDGVRGAAATRASFVTSYRPKT